MKRILILVGLILLCSCSLTTTSSTFFTRDSIDATLEAVGNFMANGHKNKIVVHPKSVSVYPISDIVDSRTTIEIPFNTWCGGPDGYRLVTHPWTTPSDEFDCQISEREESKLCRKAKDLARIVKPHLDKGLLGFSVYSGECDGQHFYYDLVTEGFVVWSL